MGRSSSLIATSIRGSRLPFFEEHRILTDSLSTTGCTIAAVPSGRWAVGVSGGADSVALLLMLAERRLPTSSDTEPADLSLHVVHLDHQLRGAASDGDAMFVTDLAAKLHLPCTIARREQIESQLESKTQPLSANPSARYRQLRMELFRQTIEREKFDGVMLAHHADDQAETILLRLLRGGGPGTLGGIVRSRKIAGIQVLRPLLNIRRRELVEFLQSRKQDWREDASNESDDYARNRVRKFLSGRPELFEGILQLGRGCQRFARWARKNAPVLAAEFPVAPLADLPRSVARQSARQWLIRQGAPPDELTSATLDRLRQMAADAASPVRQDFPGRILVQRRGGMISVSRIHSP